MDINQYETGTLRYDSDDICNYPAVMLTESFPVFVFQSDKVIRILEISDYMLRFLINL